MILHALISFLVLGSANAHAVAMAPEAAAESESYYGSDEQRLQLQQNLEQLEAVEANQVAPAPAGTRVNQCSSIKAKRLERKRLWENDATARQLDRDPARLAWRRRVLLSSQAGYSDLQAKRERDMRIIWQEFQAKQLASPFAWNQKAAVQTMLSHMQAVIARIQAPDVTYTTWNDVTLNPKLFTFASWFNSMVIARVKELLAKASSAPGTPAMADELLRVATAPYPLNYNENAAALTAFEARGILFYAMPLEARKRLIDDLHIRFDIRDVVSNSTPAIATPFTRLDDACLTSSYDCSLITDAYIYGATLPSMDGLMGGYPSDPQFTKGNGIDCSTWVQWNYLSAGIGPKAFPFRITTSAMIADPELTDNSEINETCTASDGKCDPFFRTEPIRSEWDLLPGDALVYQGHTQLFLGYNDNGDFLVSEAVGGRRRVVVYSALNIYSGDATCNTPFTSGKRYYRMFPNKPIPSA